MRPTLALLLLTAVAACSNKDEQEAPAMKVEDTAFGDMTQTLDKARSVEATTMQHKEDMDRAIDQDTSP